jgi:hypothetical protein
VSARAVSVPVQNLVTGTKPDLSGSVLLPLDSEATHMGQIPTKIGPIPPEPEPSGSDNVFLDSEPTRVGRRRRCRDMSSLSLCLCGESVRPGETSSIQCQRAGCETIWVSNCVDFASSGLNLLSIIFSVLDMRMWVQGIGLARHAHKQRRHGGGNFELSHASVQTFSVRNLLNLSYHKNIGNRFTIYGKAPAYILR